MKPDLGLIHKIMPSGPAHVPEADHMFTLRLWWLADRGPAI